jgi:hypothetical protein
MNFMPRVFRSWAIRLPLLISLSMLTIGCSNPHQVKVDVAENTLKSVMESWKSGQAPDSLQKATPPIVVQDMDWMAGAKLVDYQIIDGGKPVDSNLHAKVKLKLANSKGKETEKTVTYLVGTSPKLTVFRDMLHND